MLCLKEIVKGIDMTADELSAIMHERNSASLKHMQEPAPDNAQLTQIIEAAATAPDHGRQHPFRFLVINDAGRAKLADYFEQSALRRQPDLTEELRTRARQKAYNGPMLLAMIVAHPLEHRNIPDTDRLISAGAALQNVLLMAQALGFASRVTSGEAVREAAFGEMLSLKSNEAFVCFISIGSSDKQRQSKGRPNASDLMRIWP